VVVAEHWSLEKNLFTRSSCLPLSHHREFHTILGEKKGKKEKKHCLPADVASLQCHPLPRCWHASIVVAMRVFIQTRLLPPCSCTRFALLSSHHREFHTHFIQNATVNSTSSSKANLLPMAFCVPRTQGLKGWATARGSRGWSVERKRRAPTSMPKRAAGHGGSASLRVWQEWVGGHL
jgi:hypothetical protein